MATIRGSVFYLQRIALPPDATVVVELRDDIGGLVGTWTHTTSGEQLPIDWTIESSSTGASAPRTLAASARIVIDGRRAWVGDAIVAADEGGAADGVAIRLDPAPPPGDGPSDEEVTAIEVTELESLAEGWAE